MNPSLTLEMVERDGRVVYIDPHGEEVCVVPAAAFRRYLRWAKTDGDAPDAGASCEHAWVECPVMGTNLVRLTCSRCGAVNYGHR